jgi:hypothetical protein
MGTIIPATAPRHDGKRRSCERSEQHEAREFLSRRGARELILDEVEIVAGCSEV